MTNLTKNNISSIALTLMFLFFSHTSTTIIESDKLSTVLNYIEAENTLVIFDIDNTLAHPIE